MLVVSPMGPILLDRSRKTDRSFRNLAAVGCEGARGMMVGMGLLRLLASDLSEVVHRNAWWMTWNLLLAGVPVVLGSLVFSWRGARTLPWWTGAALFALFLPNAPYVVTDLVHLRYDVVAARSDGAVVATVLPVYAAFIAAGFLAYHLSLVELGRYLERSRFGEWRRVVEVGVHAVCAVGVVLGRFARLNSWEPVVEPHSTLERVVVTLSWRWAPMAIVGMFLVIWVGHALTRGVADAVARSVGRLAPWLRFPAAAGGTPGPA
jgi:uncharacterized membrane protein